MSAQTRRAIFAILLVFVVGWIFGRYQAQKLRETSPAVESVPPLPETPASPKGGKASASPSVTPEPSLSATLSERISERIAHAREALPTRKSVAQYSDEQIHTH